MSQTADQPSRVRCDRHGLHYDPTRGEGCVLCRKELSASEPPTQHGSLRRPLAIAAAVVFLAAAIGAVVWAVAAPMNNRADAPFAEVSASEGEQVGVLETKNSAGRSGAFYIPPHAAGDPLPMAVLLHGTGGRGENMLGGFRRLAKERKFVIVAPDSRKSPDGSWTWQVGDKPGDVTEDLTHTLACIDEVQAIPGWQLDTEHVLIAGFSGGASLAPYVATNREPFTAYAILHGGVFVGGLGTRDVAGWMSTGCSDAVRSEGPMRELHRALERSGRTGVRFEVFDGGHGLGSEEKEAVVTWWLG